MERKATLIEVISETKYQSFVPAVEKANTVKELAEVAHLIEKKAKDAASLFGLSLRGTDLSVFCRVTGLFPENNHTPTKRHYETSRYANIKPPVRPPIKLIYDTIGM